MCALGMLKTARERGVGIPANMAIIGYDDIDVARTSRPALTTIRQPIDRMAEAAYELAVAGKESAKNPQKIVFNPEIVRRVSA
jgi:DNA-binding LacI/PurR family transcriptional regulator